MKFHRNTVVNNRIRILSLGLMCLSLGATSCYLHGTTISPPTTIEGIYRCDALNYLRFSNGRFVEQYVTKAYTPQIAREQSSGFHLPQATLCRASGSYTIEGESIILKYQSDQCSVRAGSKEGRLDRSKRSISISGKVYVVEVDDAKS
ncbi:MAG: hypothetical protein ACYS74_23190 [Planctomycetota bacterium]|jgi:hypothetical protein